MCIVAGFNEACSRNSTAHTTRTVVARSKPERTNMPATRRTTIQSMADAVAYPNAISESAEKLRRCTSSAGKRGMDSVPPDGLEILAQTWIQAYSV